MTESPAHDSAPRDKRNGVILRAAITTVDGVVERRVRNLSARGACVDNEGDLVAGTSVIVAMGQLEGLVADVAWAKPALAGLSFRRTVDLEAARKPRGVAAPRAGWVGEMAHPYRKRA